MKQTLNYLTAAVIILSAGLNSCKKKDEPVKEDVNFPYHFGNVRETIPVPLVTETKNKPTTRYMNAVYDDKGEKIFPDLSAADVSLRLNHMENINDLGVHFNKSQIVDLYLGGYLSKDSTDAYKYGLRFNRYVEPEDIPKLIAETEARIAELVAEERKVGEGIEGYPWYWKIIRALRIALQWPVDGPMAGAPYYDPSTIGLSKGPWEEKTATNLADSVLVHKEAVKAFVDSGPISARYPNQCRQLLDFERDVLDVYLETIGYELIALRNKLKQLQGQLANSRGVVCLRELIFPK